MDEACSFRCEICGKLLSRKQTLVNHKETVHGIEPNYETRKYKMYMKDPKIPLPRTTAYRKKHMQNSNKNISFSNGMASTQEHEEVAHVEEMVCDDVEIAENPMSMSPNSVNSDFDEVDLNNEIVNNQADFNRTNLSNLIENSTQHNTDLMVNSLLKTNTQDIENTDSSDGSSTYTDSDSEYESQWELLESENSSNSDCEDNWISKESPNASEVFSEDDEKNMALLAYLLRFHLCGEASSKLVKLLNILYPNNEIKDIDKLKEVVGSIDAKIFHFCEKCFTLFPENEDMDECPLAGCNGLKYKGPKNKQNLKQRKSYFTCLSVCQQMQDLLEREGVLTAIKKYKSDCKAAQNITDILNGDSYKELCKPGNFLDSTDNLTLMFNTDGVPLLKSSGVSIWPVYLVINELPPLMRFSRRNMILWGIWQAKGKPVFRTFLQPFIKDMKDLHTDGLIINANTDHKVHVKAMLLASTMDLQAKAYLAEMTQHNGKHGCLTCEEPGEVVKQGRGHTRVYPYRKDAEVYKERTTDEILQCGLSAIETRKPELGIKGVSALHGLHFFDIVWGTVPDYMHGALLGITKMLMKLWFSSSNASKPYFLGRSIKNIDKILKKMKPTDDIGRLPRKIEHNLYHFKASELQMWLLFYSVPCLIDFAPEEYIDHFALLVEGMYILLGDNISREQLSKAKNCLEVFYKNFAELYGKNNCTLNLHNVCRHLPYYVAKLGPVWAWSCFAFEDMNGTILESVHGTGDVCFQILWTIQAKKRLAVDSSKMQHTALREFVEESNNTKRSVKIKHEASNCKLVGGMKKFIPDDTLTQSIRDILGLPPSEDFVSIWRCERVVINDTVFFSKQYTRMKKRIGYVILLKSCIADSLIAVVDYFVLHLNSNTCLAIVKLVQLKENSALLHPTISHLLAVDFRNEDGEDKVILVDNIKEKMLFLNGNQNKICVARLPNMYNQSS